MTKLTREDWLEAALHQLATCGTESIKAQPLAKHLKVTRGSFYYHFDDVDTFNAAVIEHWTSKTTRPLIDDVEQQERPAVALQQLLGRTMRSGSALERAIRAWATTTPLVAELVVQVDHQRIAFAEHLLQKSGLPEREAQWRAKYLYWAAIGRLMMPVPDDHHLTDGEVETLTTLIATQVPAAGPSR